MRKLKPGEVKSLAQGYSESERLEAVGWRVSWPRLEQFLNCPFLMQRRIGPKSPDLLFSFSYSNVCSKSGTVLIALYVLTYSMLPTTLCGRSYYSLHLHMRTLRLREGKELVKVTQPASSRARLEPTST